MRKAPRCVAALGAAVLTVSLSAQQPSLVFRAEANYIEVSATVTNSAGQFVKGLTAADFEVREDGRRQPIDLVLHVEIPSPHPSTGATADVVYAPDVPPEQRAVNGRLYLIYLGLMPAAYVPSARRLASTFIQDYLLPGDLAAVWDPGLPAREIRFTTDRKLLLDDVGEFLGTGVGWQDRSLSGCALGTIEHVLPVERERCGQYLRGPRTRFEEALKWFDGIQRRRKSVLLFAAGWNGEAVPGGATDVQVYPINVPGLVAGWPYLIRSDADAEIGRAHITAALPAVARSDDDLKAMAEQTGGFAIARSNTFADGFARIVDHNSQYYILGYASSQKRRNGSYRDVDVRVKRPGVRVHARRGYYAY